MSTMIVRYDELPLNVTDVLRYAGCREADAAALDLLYACWDELRDGLTNTVCYDEFPVTVRGTLCDFGRFSLSSDDLAAYFDGCDRAVLFAATVGVAADRLIAKYSRLSPSKALMMQALGAERIEVLCDRFCDEVAERYGASASSRFSPGYGDLPLAAQRDIFRVLDCTHKIGVCLNDSLLMSPSKSVTAFIGIKEKKAKL